MCSKVTEACKPIDFVRSRLRGCSIIQLDQVIGDRFLVMRWSALTVFIVNLDCVSRSCHSNHCHSEYGQKIEYYFKYSIYDLPNTF